MSPADYRLRAYVWRGLMIWSFAVWIAIIAFLAVPAARTVVEAATAHPAACATLTASDCAARMAEGLK